MVVARPRRPTAESVRLVLVPSERAEAYDPAKPDPRLVALVRLLARQATREFVDAEWERASRDRLRK
jgi:hypothetical protein